VRDELRLVALVEGGVQPDGLAAGAAGPQVLTEAGRVVCDQAVGGLEDVGGGAVILLEAEQLRLRVIAAELLQVLRARAAECIDRLVVIAHDEGIAGRRSLRGGRRL